MPYDGSKQNPPDSASAPGIRYPPQHMEALKPHAEGRSHQSPCCKSCKHFRRKTIINVILILLIITTITIVIKIRMMIRVTITIVVSINNNNK